MNSDKLRSENLIREKINNEAERMFFFSFLFQKLVLIKLVEYNHSMRANEDLGLSSKAFRQTILLCYVVASF